MTFHVTLWRGSVSPNLLSQLRAFVQENDMGGLPAHSTLVDPKLLNPHSMVGGSLTVQAPLKIPFTSDAFFPRYVTASL